MSNRQRATNLTGVLPSREARRLWSTAGTYFDNDLAVTAIALGAVAVTIFLAFIVPTMVLL
jgi:hypothetical protein